MKIRIHLLLLALIGAAPSVYAATLTFSGAGPTATPDAISNVVGAAFDANNVGGSGTNANGGLNNGATNDGSTYVASDRPAQGQTFTTGANAGGYTLSSITVRMQGYTNNTASGGNIGGYGLAGTGSTFRVRVGRLSGATFIPDTLEYAASGGAGNPGAGGAANGPGTYLTFTFKAALTLQPNTTYAFDIGSTGDYFEMLGIRDGASGGNPYVGGTAYTSGANGVAAGTITPQAGERVFQVNLTASTAPAPGVFAHPGLLNTEADFELMRTKVAMGEEPWLSAYNALNGSWMAQSGGWPSHAQATIERSNALNNSSRLYNDIAVAYGSALRWKVTGDTAYADQAVTILNAWGYTFTSIVGDTNNALNELYGYQFACAAEIMRSYSGWAAADIDQFKTMIYNVFYPLANNFLNGHFGTSYDHYWANWDLASMNTIYAIGVFCDDPTLTTQAVNYFKNGVGNGCVDRTVNFIHPGHLGQGQEIGRDQGHASLNVAELATLCQMAWNQGEDLFGYKNNRVLALAEYTAKYNLWQDVPWTNYARKDWLMTGPSSAARGATGRPGWATFYNHYVNHKGLAAPYTKTVVDLNGPNWSYNGDSPGWDYLTTAVPPIATGANPSGLTVLINGKQPQLSWWGSAYATSYQVKRSTTPGGPYTTIATGLTTNTYTDMNPVAGVTNYYVVAGSLAGGGVTGNSGEAQVALHTPIDVQLSFNEASGTTAADSTGNARNGTLVNGASWTTGKNGNAVNLAKASSQYVSLPTGVVADLSDFSISAWVYQNSASTQARIFDFGDGDGMWGGIDPWGNQLWFAERYMYLTSQGGGGKLRFGISHSASAGEQYVEGSAALPIGQWVHVTVSKSGPVATLYVNGLVVGQNLWVPMSPLQFPPTTQNYIGKSQWRSDAYFDGKIDDFKIHRGALGTGQIYTLATGLASAAPTPAPATFTVAAQVGGSMVLNWSAVTGATNYTVRRATSPDGPYTAIASLLTGTSYTDNGLAAGTTYYYQVDGVNNGGDGAFLQTSAVALPPLPTEPTGLIATAASSSSVRLIWTAASNVVSYQVKRSLTSGGPYTTVASGVTATSYTDSGLTNGTTYYYVVNAVNAAGEGADASESNATPSSLLVQLKFDETGGTAAVDSTNHGWDGATLNGPAWSTGKLGNALTLASASSQYATLPTGVVSGLSDFTISTWVKMTSQQTWQRIFDFGTSTTNFMFLTTSTGSNLMRFAIRTPSSGGEQQITSSVTTAAGAWVHVAVTLSGTSGKLYLNGALVGSNNAMTLTPASLGVTTLNYIGKSQFSSDAYLNGSVDDFRIYTRALSVSEISGLVTAPLAAPQNVAITAGDHQIALTWNAVPNATGYIVRSSTVSGGPYTTVASGSTSPTFIHTGLSSPTVCYYIVSAMGVLGEGPNLAEVGGSPLAPPVPPVGLAAVAGVSSVALNWTASADATSYNLYRSNNSGTDYALLASGLTGTSYSDTGLTNESTYYYVLAGVNAGGEGSYSAEVSAMPVPLIPFAPNGLTATGRSSTVSLGWTASGGAISYHIKRATVSGGPYTTIATGVTATTFIDATAVNGTAYYYVVSAVNANGEGVNSAEIVSVPHAPSTINKAGNTNDLNLASSWSGLVLPNAGDTARWTGLAGGNSVLLGSDFSLKGIIVTTTGGAVSLGAGHTLTLGTAGIDMSVATQNLTISSGLTLGLGRQTWNVASGRTLTLDTGAFTRDIGSTLLINKSVNTGTISASNISNTNGIVGPWMMVKGAGAAANNSANGYTWATVSGGNLAAYTDATGLTTSMWTAPGANTVNYDISGASIDMGVSRTANTFRYTGASGTTYTVGSGAVLTANGLMNAGGGLWAYNPGVVIGTNNDNELALVSGTAGLTLAGVIADSGSTPGSVMVQGENTVTLAAYNSFTGNVVVNGGTLKANIGFNGVHTTSVLGQNTVGRTATINNGGTMDLAVGNALGGGNSTIADAPKLSFIVNEGGVLKTTVNNDANIFGAITLNGGTFTIANRGADSNYQSAIFLKDITVGGSSASTINVTSSNTNGIMLGDAATGTDTITFNVADATGNANADLTVSAKLINSANSTASPSSIGALTKSGGGTMLLSAANAYTGPTTINAGTLNLTGSLTSAVTVNNGGTLAGTGTSSGAVTVATGGSLAPGNLGAGTLTISAALNLNNGGVFNMELGATGASDKLALGAGGLTASGTTTLNLTALAGFGLGTYPLITNATGINAANFALGTKPSNYSYVLSASGGTLSVTVAVLAPAPTGLTATAMGSGVTLNWNTSAGAASYNVKRSTTSGSGYATIASGVTATNYADATAALGSTYYYMVSAMVNGTEGANSGEVSAVPLDSQQAWRLQYFGSTTDSGNASDSADPDGDGWTNIQEYVSGTAPNDRSSLLKISQLQLVVGDIQLSFPSVVGKTYRVECSNTLLSGSWITVQDNIAGTGVNVQVIDVGAASSSKRFYRIHVGP